MGQPAARFSDLTSYGSIIGVPSPNVFIGKLPAVTSGAITTSSISPYSGSIIKGSNTVFINKKPALTLGGNSTDGSSIVKGELTVLIG